MNKIKNKIINYILIKGQKFLGEKLFKKFFKQFFKKYQFNTKLLVKALISAFILILKLNQNNKFCLINKKKFAIKTIVEKFIKPKTYSLKNYQNILIENQKIQTQIFKNKKIFLFYRWP